VWTEDYLPTRLYDRNPVADLGPVDAISIYRRHRFHLGKEQVPVRHAPCRGHEVQSAIHLLHLVGGNDELIFDGQSLVIDAAGNLLRQGAALPEDLLTVDLEGATPVTPRPLNPIGSLHDALVLDSATTSQMQFQIRLLGLSGGLIPPTACLAVAALGAENRAWLSLPSQFSSKGSPRRRARVGEEPRHPVGEVMPIQETSRR